MKESTGTGVGFSGLLFITFLVLKLCHVIDWSWWWITAPLWIPAGIGLVAIIIGLIILLINYIKLNNVRKQLDKTIDSMVNKDKEIY